MSKSDTMMLCSFQCRVSFVACVEITQQMCQSLELPFAAKHGGLVSGFLTRAKYWCQADDSKGKSVAGLPAVKHLFGKVKDLEAPAGQEKTLMQLAPFLQLLMGDDRMKVRQLINGLDNKSGPLKRLGSKQSLGMLKRKKVVASASASASSGASMKIDLFDYD